MHTELVLTVCLVGLVTNILCVITLSQRHMKRPINALLTSVSVVDGIGLTLFSFLLIAKPALPCPPKWFIYLNIPTVHAVTILNISMNPCLTIAIAAVRFFGIRQRSPGSVLTINHVTIIVSAAFFFCISFEVPSVIRTRIDSLSLGNETCWRYVYTDHLVSHTTLRWFQFAFSLVLCVSMVLFSMLILLALVRAQKKHRTLISNPTTSNGCTSTNQGDIANREHLETRRKSSRWSKTARTTVVILGMMLFSILTFITTLVVLMGELFGVNTLTNFYLTVYCVKNVLVVVNSSVNIVFYSINLEFRETLRAILTCRKCRSDFQG